MRANRKPKRPNSNSSSSKLVLQEIIGLTTNNANGFASSTYSNKCVYIAGCVAVVYDVESGTQSHLMVSHRTPKPLNCVALSLDGRFVAAGESGNLAAVLVWDSANRTFISELRGHLYGVTCIAFSSNGNHLVSAGGYIYLWEWQSKALVTKIKAGASVSTIRSMAFSTDARCLVTAGNKHLKSWSVGVPYRTRSRADGKPLNVALERENLFVAVASPLRVSSQCGSESSYTYVLTEAGLLCLIHCGTLKKSVKLQVTKGFALSLSEKLIACGCTDGLVLLFAVESLEYAGTLSYSMANNCHDQINHSSLKSREKDFWSGDAHPDVIACGFCSEKLVVIYRDHSLFVWDVDDVKKVTRCCVLVSHTACIWDIKNLCCENVHDSSLACIARGCSGGVSFATCSADGTIRLWDFLLQNGSLKVNSGVFERDNMWPGNGPHGFQTLAVSSDGKYVAAGDCGGSLHIYNLHTYDYTCLEDIHDAEILSLCFSLPCKKDAKCNVKDNCYFLASGGRDGIIHLFDVTRNFYLAGSIDDHSAAVTSVKLVGNGCKLLSCGADRSLVLREIIVTDCECRFVPIYHRTVSKGTIYHMDLDRAMDVAVTVGEDKKINVFNVSTGKLLRSIKQDKDVGDPIKVSMDPSCSFLVCSYSNKSICIYDFVSGKMVAQADGHAEVVTSVTFLPDCKHMITVGGDGCIFVWKMPDFLSSRMLQNILENSDPLTPICLAKPLAFNCTMFTKLDEKQTSVNSQEMLIGNSTPCGGLLYELVRPRETSVFDFSISRLPKWAQGKITSVGTPDASLRQVPSLTGEDIQTPKKYACRDDGSCITAASGSSGSSNFQSCSIPQESSRNFVVNKRWLSIYTVCMDLQDSPETWAQDNERIHTPFQDLGGNEKSCEIQAGHRGQISDTDFFGLAKSLVDSGNSCLDNRQHSNGIIYGTQNFAQGELHDSPSGHKPPASVDSGQLSANKAQSEVQETFEMSTSHMSLDHKDVSNEVIAYGTPEKLYADETDKDMQDIAGRCNFIEEHEDNSLFNQHFGSLSAALKLRKRDPPMRKRYSAQYVVRNCLGGWKKFLDSSDQDLGCRNTLRGHIEPNLQSHDVPTESRFQDPQSSRLNVVSSLDLSDESKCTESTEARNQNKPVCGENEVLRRLRACTEVLLNLDSAAKDATCLFAELISLVSEEELLHGQGAELYAQASNLIPSIAENANMLNKLLTRDYDNISTGN